MAPPERPPRPPRIPEPPAQSSGLPPGEAEVIYQTLLTVKRDLGGQVAALEGKMLAGQSETREQVAELGQRVTTLENTAADARGLAGDVRALNVDVRQALQRDVGQEQRLGVLEAASKAGSAAGHEAALVVGQSQNKRTAIVSLIISAVVAGALEWLSAHVHPTPDRPEPTYPAHS